MLSIPHHQLSTYQSSYRDILMLAGHYHLFSLLFQTPEDLGLPRLSVLLKILPLLRTWQLQKVDASTTKQYPLHQAALTHLKPNNSTALKRRAKDQLPCQAGEEPTHTTNLRDFLMTLHNYTHISVPWKMQRAQPPVGPSLAVTPCNQRARKQIFSTSGVSHHLHITASPTPI